MAENAANKRPILPSSQYHWASHNPW